MTRAPLRWAGSKRKSIPALTSRFPAAFEKYVEPFAGSACIAFHLKPARLALGDLNPQLVEFYQFLRDEPAALHQAYMTIPANPDAYYSIRKSYNQGHHSVERAAQFLYLNRHCFNGIYRVNKKGEFNVPWGGDKVGAPLTLSDILEASNVLQGAEIECSDFEYFIDRHIEKNAFIYIDPPLCKA